MFCDLHDLDLDLRLQCFTSWVGLALGVNIPNTTRRHDLQKVKVKGQGQGHEGHKIVRILKLQYPLEIIFEEELLLRKLENPDME